MASLGFDAFGNMIAMAVSTPAIPPRPVLTPKRAAPPSAPAFIYYISRGELVAVKTGAVVGSGLWSGHGQAKNDPGLVHLKGVGPLPPGLYAYGYARDGGHLGPVVMPLIQLSGESYGRSGFFIHGASSTHPDMSSDGCIIAPREVRVTVDSFATASRRLEVRP